MKKIRILLDYRAYPIWLFNEMGDLVHGKVKEENPEQGNGKIAIAFL